MVAKKKKTAQASQIDAEVLQKSKELAAWFQSQLPQSQQSDRRWYDNGRRYRYPNAPFKTGDRVWLNGKQYTIQGSTHTHTQLVGEEYAVANWERELILVEAMSKRPPEAIAA